MYIYIYIYFFNKYAHTSIHINTTESSRRWCVSRRPSRGIGSVWSGFRYRSLIRICTYFFVFLACIVKRKKEYAHTLHKHNKHTQAHTHTHTHTHAHAHTNTHCTYTLHIYKHTHAHTNTQAQTHINTQTHMYTQTHIRTQTHTKDGVVLVCQ